jgi:DNA-binding MarR family transcriptional regulator
MTPGPDRRLQQRIDALKYNPLHCIHRHVSRAARLVAARFDEAFATHGLTAGQFTTLMTLGNGGPVSISRLAEQLATDPTTVPRVIRPLVERGCVTIERGTDRRVRIVAITERGIDRLIDALPVWERVQASMLSGLPEDRWPEVRHGIAALRHGARNASSPDAGAEN